MAHASIILDEPAVTDKLLDTESVSGHPDGTVQRERMEIAGASLAEIARVKNSTPLGSDYALATRNIPRKEGGTLSTTPLGVSGSFAQAWQDANADGVLFVQAVARADQASATNGFVIEETDDDTDANFTRTANQVSVPANTTTFLYAVIRGRKWRVRYVNGGTGQTSFKLTATASVLPMFTTDAAGLLQVGVSGTVNVNPTGETAGVGVGAVADAEATGNGSVIAILKRIRTLLGGTLTTVLGAALPAGTNNIGDVDVASLPSLPAGDNNIGNVDLASAIPAGTNVVGGVRGAGYQNASWTSTHEPAANTRATTTKAAAGSGVKNVCTSITATLAAQATAPSAVQVAVRLRDGTSDTGTVLWASVLALPATAGAVAGVALSNLWIEGTANTAMTLEFSAAGGANTIEVVAMSGTTI